MSFALWRRLKGQSGGRRPGRPQVEQLEGRCLPSGGPYLLPASVVLGHPLLPIPRHAPAGGPQAAQVTALYRAYLHQKPTAGQLKQGVALVAAGAVDQLRAQILGSATYFKKRAHHKNDRFLAAVAQDVLGHPLDASHLQQYAALLAHGTSRAAVAALVLQLTHPAPASSESTSTAPTGPTAAGPTGTLSIRPAFLDVSFSAPMADAAFAAAGYALQIDAGPNDGQAVAIASVSRTGAATARLTLAAPLPNGGYRLTLAAALTDLDGNPLDGPTTFRFTVAAPAHVTELSPANGEDMVSVARTAVARFDTPMDPATITPASFYLVADGQHVPGTVRVSGTKRFATFIPTDPLPASTEVRVVVDGDQVKTADGVPLDGNNDGQPGGQAVADFRTLPLTRIPGTDVFGYVYDSYNKNPDGSNPDGSNIPVVGATVRVDAFPQANAVTDQNGFFTLKDMPAPSFFGHVDGVPHPSG
jgi:hypothetical protein